MRKPKQPTKDEVWQRWYRHVKMTPSGHVPVLFSGIPAWRIVGKREDIERNFALWPREHWPEWVVSMLPVTQ